MSHMIVAIDGPAGSGKSTVAKRVAEKLSLLYIDTGAMYRALTLKAMRKHADFSDERALSELAKSTRIELDGPAQTGRVLLDGEDVTGKIRSNELTRQVKYVARVPGVRSVMVEIQRKLGREQGGVLEGRDIGTVVFPDTPLKFYLDADLAVRSDRRLKDLQAAGQKAVITEVEKDLVIRDESDMKRSTGPLVRAPGAFLIDTTHLSVEEVVDTILAQIGRCADAKGGG